MTESPTIIKPHRSGDVPHLYSSATEEYRALSEGVAMLDRSSVGRLRLTGEDALDLLDRLSTNDLAGLEAGTGAPTVLTSNKGRIVDLLYAFRLDGGLLVLTSPDACQKVADWIDFYTIIEDVVVEDLTADTAMLSLAGPGAASLLGKLTVRDVTAVERYESFGATINGVEAAVYRTDFVLPHAYDLLVDAAHAEELWADVLESGRDAGLVPAGAGALEAVRVEQGTPVHGKELSEDFNPLEANLRDYISFTKGCYVGQEVVARLETYKKVQKQLVGLTWDFDDSPETGAKLFRDGKQVGVVTSAVRSPRLSRGIGLGYVRNAHAVPGTVLATELTDSETDVVVAGLPFRSEGN